MADVEDSAPWELDSAHGGALLRLDRLLRGSHGFVLAFIIFGDSSYRAEVVEHLRHIGLATEAIDVDPDALDLAGVMSGLRGLSGQSPVNLYGLGDWLKGSDPNERLRLLNYVRESLAAAAGRPVLIWLDADSLKTIVTGAPDLWAWRSAVLDFTRPMEPGSGESDILEILDLWAPEEDRRLAQETLTTILAKQDDLTDTRTLSDVSIDARLESELEIKFLAALQSRVELRDAAWRQAWLQEGPGVVGQDVNCDGLGQPVRLLEAIWRQAAARGPRPKGLPPRGVRVAARRRVAAGRVRARRTAAGPLPWCLRAYRTRLSNQAA